MNLQANDTQVMGYQGVEGDSIENIRQRKGEGKYRKLIEKQFPASTKNKSSSYFTKFNQLTIHKQFSSIDSISVNKNIFSITCQTKVLIYKNSQLVKTINRSKAQLCSTDIKDSLLLAGDLQGTIQLFDLNSRAILKTIQAHQNAIRAILFLGKNMIISASDDFSIKLFDFQSDVPIHTFYHKDHVRSLSYSSLTNTLISGSYDHSINIYNLGMLSGIAQNEQNLVINNLEDDGMNIDTDNYSKSESKNDSKINLNLSYCEPRTSKPNLSLDHGCPVEKVLFLKGDGLICSAGGNKIRIWDLKTSKNIVTLQPHSKTITCLALDSTKQYLLTGSLDHQVKIIDLVDYRIIHSIKYPAPILSIGVSSTNSEIVVGMSNGLLSIRKRVIKPIDDADLIKPMVSDPVTTNTVSTIRIRTKKLADFDRFLKSFKYSDALDSVLSRNNPVIILSMLDELCYRGVLKVALSNRDFKSLSLILRFVSKFITHSGYTERLIEVADTLVELYSTSLSTCGIDKLLMVVRSHLVALEGCGQVLGMLDSLFVSSTTHQYLN